MILIVVTSQFIFKENIKLLFLDDASKELSEQGFTEYNPWNIYTTCYLFVSETLLRQPRPFTSAV